MSSKGELKSARLIALGHSIQCADFDPATVNMSDLAELFGVHRGTIMRDLRVVEDMLELAKTYQSKIRSASLGESRRTV